MKKAPKKPSIKKSDVERIDADILEGLTSEQVEIRQCAHMTNDVKKPVGKSLTEIFVHNFLNIYNLILVLIASMLIYAQQYSSLLFAVIYIANLVIGLYQDLKARHLLMKLQLVTQATVIAVRNGEEVEIPVNEICLDDIVIFKTGDQISADAIVLNGSVGVNESMLTGESLTVYKEKDAVAYAGSYVTSGKCYARVFHVGKENYVNSLESKARDKKRVTSKLKKSLNYLFLGILLIVLPLCVAVFFANAGSFSTFEEVKETIGKISGSILAMVPAGLYLLASASLTVGVINLARKRTMVQDMYSLEMLARSTVLCLDKTGTITDGTMRVKDVMVLSGAVKEEVELMIANIENATNDDNATSKAIKKAFAFGATEKPLYVCPFNSENKYAFVTFKKGTYVLGALECIDALKKTEIAKKVQMFSKQGLRVVVFGKAKESQIGNKVLKGKVEIQALIALEDHIKEDAAKTIDWFQSNSVKIRVISGDNAETVSQIAKRVNIKDADRFVSLAGKTDEEVKELAKDYVVFGRVSPEQKEILVSSLKEAGETVAMTGDGVNDILALRKADCSIAMANGADAAQNVSQLVMLDSNFSSLPAVVAEGRRTINNIQRTSSLFLTKTIFAITLTLIFTIATFRGGDFYPFETNHLYLWEFSTIGVGSFFIALEPNSEIINEGFLRNIFKKALPGALMMMSGVGVFYLLWWLNRDHGIYTGIGSEDIFVTLCSIFFAIGALAIFYRISAPLSKYRFIVFIGSTIITICALTFGILMEYYLGITDIFKIDVFKLIPVNILELLVVSIGLISIYTAVTYIWQLLEIRKKEKKAKHDKNI